MSDKLACIILDALGPYSMRTLDMEYMRSLYRSEETTSGLLGTSGLAHTPISNALMWGNYHNDDAIWVEQHPHRWTGGIDGFDPTIKQFDDDDVRFFTRSDFETNFIWDVLDHHGLDPVALGLPFCYNADVRLGDAWFPHTEEGLAHHVQKKPLFVQHHALQGHDFIACSIKVPDQWLHALGSGMVDENFVDEQVPILEAKMERTIEVLEAEGYDWLVFGDHGAPRGGRTAVFECKKLCARHRREAAIIGTTDRVPRYTGEMYDFILDYFGVEDVQGILDWKPEQPPADDPNEYVPMDSLMEIYDRFGTHD